MLEVKQARQKADLAEQESSLGNKLDPYKSIGFDGIHPRILKDLDDVIAKHLSMIFEWSWEPGEVPADWKLANIVPIFKKGLEGILSKFADDTKLRGAADFPQWQRSLAERPQQIRGLSNHQPYEVQQREVTNSLHEMRKLSAEGITNFIEQVTHLVREGKAVDVFYQDFSKAFDNVSHSILLEKLVAHGLDGTMLSWQSIGQCLLSPGGASSTPGTNCPGVETQSHHGLIQAALEKSETPKHLKYTDNIIVWGSRAEVSEKGEKIIQILLKAGFAIKWSEVKGLAREIQFLGMKWQDGHCQIPT
ncbi:hypothetical protein BTVI_40646 [Pitangus sulphuratus]|nr:hypothetical protein BTVI_40646 [Pitangus sulphuratus]